MRQLETALAAEKERSSAAELLASAQPVEDTVAATGADPGATKLKPGGLQLVAQVRRLETALSVERAANEKHASQLAAIEKHASQLAAMVGRRGDEREANGAPPLDSEGVAPPAVAAAAFEARKEVALHDYESPHLAPARSKALSDALALARRWQLAAFGFGALLLPPVVLGLCYVASSAARFLRKTKTKTRDIMYTP